MKHLLLYRHAKSSWSNETLNDVDRPLNERGRDAAERMATFIDFKMPPIDLVLCSSSQRTRETLAPLLIASSHPFQIEMRRELYLASSDTHLKTLRACPKETSTVMIIAHNPGIEDFAQQLIGQGADDLRQKLSLKYPTAALTQIDFDVEDWKTVNVGIGYLQAFITPKDEVTFSP